MTPILEVKSISKKYHTGSSLPYRTLRDSILEIVGRKKKKQEKFWALRQLSFSLRAGEVVGIIGRNGAGKSTLLKILSRITPPTHGEIIIRGKVASLLEVGTGFHPELTGRENIYLNGSILGMTRRQIDAKLSAIIEFSGIEKFIDMPAKHFSSGMYTRLAFAVAAHLDADIMLVDEVLAVGDAAFQKKSLAKMEEKSSQNGKTILFVSHDLNAVQKLCPKTILLNDGRVAYFGPTATAINKYLKIINSVSSIPLAKRKDIQGNRDIIINKVMIKSKSVGPQAGIAAGSPLEIVLSYIAARPLSKVSLAIGIDNKLGKRIATLHSDFSPGNPFSLSPSELNGNFVCSIASLDLRPEVYSLNLYLEAEGKVSFHLPYATSLTVLAGDIYQSGKYPSSTQGDMLVRHIWKHDH